MTREEKIAELINIRDNFNYTLAPREVFDDAIKALEQEPILDKIRAEIEQNAYPIVHGVNNHEKGMTLNGILQIIDKYKGESEDKE